MKAFSIIAFLLAFLSGGNNVYTPGHMPLAKKGIIDLTAWSYDDNGFIYLNGEWEFYWNKLLSPGEIVETEQKKYRDILDSWKDDGYATYKLKIKLKDPGRYAIYTPMVLIAHKLWIDDNLIGAQGVVGTSRDAENPKIQNYIEEVYLTEGIHNITIQVSNYRLQTGGVRLPISFGKYKDLQDYRELKLFIEALMLGLVAFMIINHFVAFLVSEKNYSHLYFILVCICNFLFFFFRSERFLLKFFLDLNWEVLAKIGFSAIFSIVPALLLFNHSLYPIEFIKKILKPVKIIWGIFIAYILFLPSFYYSYIVPAYKIFILVIFVFFFIQAKTVLKKRTKGSFIASSGVIIFVIGLANEIFYDNRISPLSIFVPCQLFLLFTQSFLTSIKSSEAFEALKKSREEIANKNIELSRLSELKDNFLSNTSHELKTPLHGIIGIAETLKDGIAGPVNHKTEENLSIIINSANRLSYLVNDILDVQRLKNKDIQINPSSFDLYQIVHTIIQLSVPLLQNKPVELITTVTPGKIFVHADPNRLYQIIQNLVSNACKFTETGKIEITAFKTGDLVEIAVIDTGIGIQEGYLEKIFEPFEQGEAVSTGSGLGLSITKKLVELHDGSISVESTSGKGSKFFFTVYAALETAKDINLSETAKPVIETDNIVFEGHPENKGKQILVIDDEPISLKVVSEYLTMAGFNVDQCKSGEEALAYLENNKPCLVLLDVMMPKIDGFTVCKTIREKYSALDLPIIFLTAKNQVTDLVEGFALGGNDYLTKPFSKHELLARVGGQLTISRAKDRLCHLRDYANKIWLVKNTDTLVKELFEHILNDPKVSSAALFQDDNIVKSTYPDKKKLMELFNQWSMEGKKDQTISDHFLFLNFKKIKNSVIFIEIPKNIESVDIEYFKNLGVQTESIVKNFQQLLSDSYFMEDIHIISMFKKNIRFIRSEGKQIVLYEDKNDQKHYLHSSLNTIECFYADDLIRVNRTCLVNSQKIIKVEKNYDDKKRIEVVFINVDGERINVTKTYINSLPTRKQKA